MSYTVKSVLQAEVIHDAGRDDSPMEKVTIIGFDVVNTAVLAMTVEGEDGQLHQFPLWPTVRINTAFGKSMTGDQLLEELVKKGKVNEIKPPPPRVEFYNPPPNVHQRKQQMVPLRRWEVYGLTFVVVMLFWEIIRRLL